MISRQLSPEPIVLHHSGIPRVPRVLLLTTYVTIFLLQINIASYSDNEFGGLPHILRAADFPLIVVIVVDRGNDGIIASSLPVAGSLLSHMLGLGFRCKIRQATDNVLQAKLQEHSPLKSGQAIQLGSNVDWLTT